MKITGLTLSFLQVECLAGPLSALQAPAVPFKFLLSGPEYQQHVARLTHESTKSPPASWQAYGTRFWRYYTHHASTPKELWRSMVPLYYEFESAVGADWLNGSVAVKTYLYPWAIALVIGVGATGSMTLDEAFNLGLNARRQKEYETRIGGEDYKGTLEGLVRVVLATIRTEVFGGSITPGQIGELFSIVTVLDAEGAEVTQPPAEGGDLHHSMEGMVDWNVLYKETMPRKLDVRKIETKRPPLGHILYGGRRGRFVWFPGSFRSNAPYTPDTLTCYHQNLTVASLHTESLCRLAKDTADRLAVNPTISNTSLAYQSCAQLGAGLLGRLYGGTSDTYRSHSLREQISRGYQDSVSSVRNYFKMSGLIPPSP